LRGSWAGQSNQVSSRSRSFLGLAGGAVGVVRRVVTRALRLVATASSIAARRPGFRARARGRRHASTAERSTGPVCHLSSVVCGLIAQIGRGLWWRRRALFPSDGVVRGLTSWGGNLQHLDGSSSESRNHSRRRPIGKRRRLLCIGKRRRLLCVVKRLLLRQSVAPPTTTARRPRGARSTMLRSRGRPPAQRRRSSRPLQAGA
jgi:hypothetical protein